jgi:hypothetical protein
LSVFKGRVVDPNREKDTAVERCDVSVEDGDGKAKSRFVIKIICRHGNAYTNFHMTIVDLMNRCDQNLPPDL